MRALLWLLALCSAAVGLAIAARHDAGYVLFVAAPYRIELSLNLFVVLVLAAFALGYLALRLLLNMIALPRRVREYRTRREEALAARRFEEALRRFFEGRYGHALKEAAAAFDAAAPRPLAALLAARAASAMHDDAREREWMSRAGAGGPEPRLALLMTELELDIEARRFDAAARVLERLAESGQKHVAAQRLALRVHAALGRWQDLLRTLRALEKHRAIAPEHASALRQRAHLETIRALRSDAGALAAYWSALPRAERDDARVVAALARALLGAGECAEAQRIIESRLDDVWEEELVPMYAECAGGDALARITRAERWLRDRPHDAALLLALGRLCEQHRLWGKAESYLEASLAVRSAPEAHLALARLLDSLDRREEADRHFRAAALAR
ncbi:MAG TPA: heme biosynthesis protein HemY [Rhodocyclaceae bacterium]|nr:MAG: heme biosynthesis protein HemY [Rhodocyclales bacterium CG_4_10_14_3_um_filter_68_10]PJA58591.1 MAG: heme biosynthesis protein HemY [Rhodocyclales bacterium CG_4_9_14_3_um_filter_68_10]HCX32369.1 heme biosynthesis protein HemY [Rhodocyclaceae bacterium]